MVPYSAGTFLSPMIFPVSPPFKWENCFQFPGGFLHLRQRRFYVIMDKDNDGLDPVELMEFIHGNQEEQNNV